VKARKAPELSAPAEMTGDSEDGKVGGRRRAVGRRAGGMKKKAPENTLKNCRALQTLSRHSQAAGGSTGGGSEILRAPALFSSFLHTSAWEAPHTWACTSQEAGEKLEAPTGSLSKAFLGGLKEGGQAAGKTSGQTGAGG